MEGSLVPVAPVIHCEDPWIVMLVVCYAFLFCQCYGCYSIIERSSFDKSRYQNVIHISVYCTFIFQTAHCTSTVSVFVKNNCCSAYKNL